MNKDIEQMKKDLIEWGNDLRAIINIINELKQNQSTEVILRCNLLDTIVRKMYSRMNEIYKELI